MDEIRELARLTEISRKQRVVQRYNVKVVKREFVVNDLVLRRASIGQKKCEGWENCSQLGRSIPGDKKHTESCICVGNFTRERIAADLQYHGSKEVLQLKTTYLFMFNSMLCFKFDV